MALKAKATQEFVPIKEVRNGVVVLKNGELRAIVLANSTNLSLKSDEEQKATIFQFQNFLNTLDFPIQISVQSRKLDIRPYLLLLENRIKVQNEPLLKLQTKEYIEFIRNFTDSVNIMTKNFFVVVPYTNAANLNLKKQSGLLKGLFSKKSGGEAKEAEHVDFEEKRSQLDERVSVIQQGLSNCGIKSVQLGSEEVIEVFYKVFNPGELEGKIKLEETPQE
jgi:pterin-4a-carbinolamine dehydratase